jgi:uncharacterized protein (AIM24 family)
VQTLQIVLRHRRYITIDMNALCWCSDFDSVKFDDRRSIFARLFPTTGLSLTTVTNSSAPPLLLGLNQTEAGKILVLRLENAPLYVFNNFFICATDEVYVRPKLLPLQVSLLTAGAPQIFNSTHLCTGVGGTVYLQASSAILQKTLRRGETTTIRFTCIVAFESTCTIAVVSPYRSTFVNFHSTFIKFDGPGTVYFSSHTLQRASATGGAQSPLRGLVRPNNSMLAIIIHFITVVLSLYTVFLILSKIDLDELVDNRNRLQ